MTDSHYRRNMVALLIDYVLFGAMMNFIGVTTVLPAFVRTLTGSALLIGLVNTIWNGGWLIPQLIAANALNHVQRKKSALLQAGLAGRPALLVIALALALGLWRWPNWMLVIFFGMLALFWVADAFCSIAWFDIVAKAVPVQRRGRLFGAGQVIGGLMAFGIGAFVSWILGPQGPTFPFNYACLFGLAGAATLGGLVALAAVHEPLEDVPEERVSWRDYLPQLVKILREQPVYRRTIAAWLLSGLSNLASPFYVVYATEQLKLEPKTIGIFIIAQTVGGLLASLGFGALAERRGPGAVIRISIIANISGPLVALTFNLAHLSSDWMLVYVWVFVVLGIVGSAMMLGWMNYILELAPPGHRPTYMGLSNTLGGLLVLVPMLGGWLLEATSYPVLFAAAVIGPILAWTMAARLPASHASRAG